MLRLAALVVILLGAGIGYEQVTGNQLGISSAIRSFGDLIGGWAQGVRSPAFGGWGGLGG